jgi:small subunit ribosomal protein S20
MTHSRSAEKRVRQNRKNRVANRERLSGVRTAIKRVEKAAAGGDKAEIAKAVSAAFARIDKAARTKAIHANTAARRKALVARRAAGLKAAAVKSAS